MSCLPDLQERLSGDCSDPETVLRVIGVLKELEDDVYREPADRFSVDEIAIVADAAKSVIRVLFAQCNYLQPK